MRNFLISCWVGKSKLLYPIAASLDFLSEDEIDPLAYNTPQAQFHLPLLFRVMPQLPQIHSCSAPSSEKCRPPIDNNQTEQQQQKDTKGEGKSPHMKAGQDNPIDEEKFKSG